MLDENLYITYEMVCCTFLLGLFNNLPCQFTDKLVLLFPWMITSKWLITSKNIMANVGMDQMLIFLTGLAGAGKTTAIKAAEWFCFEFCSSCDIMWTDTLFFYTAYIGSAASAFGWWTIVMASSMCMTIVTENQPLDDPQLGRLN